jgi:hypothetical protein
LDNVGLAELNLQRFGVVIALLDALEKSIDIGGLEGYKGKQHPWRETSHISIDVAKGGGVQAKFLDRLVVGRFRVLAF